MAKQNVNYDVTNLMIPAFGQTNMVVNNFNLTNGYELDCNAVTIESIPFRPQSVTLDCSSVPDGETVTFTIKQINYVKIVDGGNTITFNFPAIANMIFEVIPSDNVSEIRGFFYNFPSFPDQEIQPVSASGGGVQDVNLVSPDPLPVTFSAPQDINIVSPDPLPVAISTIDSSVKSQVPLSIVTVFSTVGAIGGDILPAAGVGFHYVILTGYICQLNLVTNVAPVVFCAKGSISNIELIHNAKTAVAAATAQSGNLNLATPIILGDNEALTISTDIATNLVSGSIRFSFTYLRLAS
jgi:hypothetical protein